MGGCAHLPRKQTPLPHNCVQKGIPTVLPQPVESSPPGPQGVLVIGAGWMSSHPSPSCQQHSKEQTGPGALISKDSPKLTRGLESPSLTARHPPFSHILTAQQVGRAGASPKLHISHSQFVQPSCHFAGLI